MLFNSYEFLFLFLPVTLLGFWGITRLASHSAALTWLVFASLAFYSWWNPPYVLFLAGSVVANYILAQLIIAKRKSNPRISKTVTILGVVANLCLIGYYKYRNFFLDGVEFVSGFDFPGQELILPLGISFFTFQQIAYLVDSRVGVVGQSSFRDYALFVTFFPQLIAGPIVHHKEMMPQFAKSGVTETSQNLVIGSVLFCVGLFKKVIIADGIAVYANPVFDLASTGSELDLFFAWQGALAYALQLYFDFSGYSEMALGLARMFGVVLPVNFNSPFKQSSIISFWGCWHITLTRFFTAYIYNPIALRVTRSRARRRLSLDRSSPGAFVALVALPTIATMTLAGLWHGAGAQYVVFGLLHGGYLTVNHGWRSCRTRIWTNEKSYESVMRPVGWLITFVAVVVGMVFFRADSVAAAVRIIEGMCGFNGALIPLGIVDRLPIVGEIAARFGVQPAQHLGKEFIRGILWITAGLISCLLCPNILQILRQYNPALGMPENTKTVETKTPSGLLRRLHGLKWQPTRAWLCAQIVIVVVGILALSQETEFLYWQF